MVTELRIGSLFSGYGGLDMAVQAALSGGQIVWHSDIKPASCALLRHRHPDVPNLGDMTAIDYAASPPIDVLAASWPCQPHSSAGKRLGEADPRALGPDVARAVAATRPALFFGENVARIASNGELRRVARSLAALGYVGAWRVLRASDVYAPHRRERCFVVAVDPAAYARSGRLPQHPQRHGPALARQDGERWGDALRRGARGEDRLTLQTAAVTLLPTPTARTYGTNQGGAAGRTGAVRESLDTMARNERLIEWGQYAEAIARWGCAFDREAPEPTQISPRNGKPQLSPRFVEWMMGLPEGWVCDVPDLAPRASGHRNAALSLLGDGVVPQQGAAAFRFLLSHLADRLSAGVAA